MCDTYLQGCREVGTEGRATLALIDLAKIPVLNLTYNALGLEAVSVAMLLRGLISILLTAPFI